MKKCIKMVSVVLVLCLAFALMGCGKTDKEKLVGDWKCTVDLKEMLDEQMKGELGEAVMEFFSFSECNLVLDLTFTKDGKCNMSLNEEAMAETMEVLKADLIVGVKKMMEAMLEGTGISVEEALAMSGTSLEEMAKDMNLEAMMEDVQFSKEGVYDAKDGKLYMSASDTINEEEYSVYTLEKDTLTLTEIVEGDVEELKPFLPLVFERQ